MRAMLFACCGLALAASVEAQGGGTWETKSPMRQPRSGVAATVDGKIYQIGGWWTWDSPVVNVEEYDPATDTWVVKGPMQNPRSPGAAVTLDGKVYVIAGYYGGGSYADTVNEYDAATDTWRVRASLPVRAVGASAAVLDGKIHAFGGNVARRAHYQYDPAMNVWTAKATMLHERYMGGGVALNGRIYAVGGHSTTEGYLSSVEAYDPATNTWVEVAPMSVGRFVPYVAALNGKIYVFGGHGPSGDSLASGEEYDPESNVWRPVTPMPTARAGAATGVVHGVVYLFGGATAAGGHTEFLSSAIAFTPPTASLQLTKSTVTGCLNASARITLPEPAPAGGVTVTLHSDNPNATVPSSVTVKAGATKKSFPVETSAVAASETATIEASLPEGVASAVLTLEPMGVKSVTLTPNPVVGGVTVAGLLTLPCPAGPGDIAVTLTSTKAFIAEPTTDTILIPVGTQDMPFEVRTTPVFAPVSLAIKATANEATKSRKLTMEPAP
jgi:N-acetylneuraminic acid mutarotase